MTTSAVHRNLATLLCAATLPGCGSTDVFATEELITVTETSTKLMPTDTTITSATSPATAMVTFDTYRVGEDIAAGTYATAGPKLPGSTCTWEILPAVDAHPDQALAFVMLVGPARLVVTLGDIVRAGGACEWTLRP